MGQIQVTTHIKASVQICFDLSRSVDLHIVSASSTSEKIIGGVSTGLLELNDEVHFEGWHFGFLQRLKAKIVEFQSPFHFKDVQIDGVFLKFEHDHFFELEGQSTVMKDVIHFRCPYGLFGAVADPVIALYLKKFIKKRGEEIKRVAESEDWKLYLRNK